MSNFNFVEKKKSRGGGRIDDSEDIVFVPYRPKKAKAEPSIGVYLSEALMKRARWCTGDYVRVGYCATTERLLLQRTSESTEGWKLTPAMPGAIPGTMTRAFVQVPCRDCLPELGDRVSLKKGNYSMAPEGIIAPFSRKWQRQTPAQQKIHAVG